MDFTLAIVIPALNEERFIGNCLDCLIRQTFPFEKMDVMVIDGGSSDATRSIVRGFVEKWTNVRLIDNPGKIQSIAFNIGVKESNAPFIIRLDAHALYSNDYVEKCLADLNADSNRGNVGGKCVILPYDNSLWANTNAILNYSRFGIGGSAFRIGVTPQNVDSVPFGAFPRSVIEKVGGMREDLRRGEDNEINSRIRKAGYKVYFNPEIVSSYYARPTLRSSCKQMFANGESIGHLFYVDRESIGLRHLIPLLFVLGLILGAIISLLFRPLFYVFVTGLGLYFLCDLVASVTVGAKHGWKYCLPIFVMFFCVHLSYGIGTIKGLITGRKLKKK